MLISPSVLGNMKAVRNTIKERDNLLIFQKKTFRTGGILDGIYLSSLLYKHGKAITDNGLGYQSSSGSSKQQENRSLGVTL